MNDLKELTIGEIVAKNYRAATVFKAFNIDFCCKGGRTIAEACTGKNIDEKVLTARLLEELGEHRHESFAYQTWPMDLLADYIEKKHHRYVKERIPLLLQFLSKLVKVHGEHNPELIEIHELFSASAAELTAHMEREELILFPYVRKMMKFMDGTRKFDAPQFDTVRNPILQMMQEHENEGGRFEQIRALSDNFTPPGHACNTYKVTYALLEEFEQDLHKHIHLENNILFPKAIDSELNIQGNIIA